MADLSAPGFLARWARRKALAGVAGKAEREEAHRAPVAPEAPEAVAEGSSAPECPPETRGGHADAAPVLPDIDGLTRGSDFSVFMADGVPVELRNRALRKLWRLDPVFANLDGLNDYDQDYTDAAVATGIVRTAYRVGRGFVDHLDAKEDEAPTDAADAGTDDPGRTADGAGEPDAVS
ncbi:MAG TPA: DUF3306 domain-containing protein [Arenibaculum sp.]|nr:DUF3306 domain-containing protein [Arenibaculum sp.]